MEAGTLWGSNLVIGPLVKSLAYDLKWEFVSYFWAKSS